MKEIDNGGTAFPYPIPGHQDKGMTLRDWFAGMAMQGMYAADTADWFPKDALQRAEAAYRAADAMIYQRTAHEKEAGE